MSKKIPIDLTSVQETLLLPLWGRAAETRKAAPRLSDPLAVQIIDAIDYDFSTIANNIGFLTQYAWIARSLHFDRTIRSLLKQHSAATVVNLGCGLDTTFERVDDGRVSWIDLDLPDVIELRRKFIHDTDRRRTIASSVLDYRWFDAIGVKRPVMFLAGGVLYYFEEEEVRDFFIHAAAAFPNSEIVFDSASPFGVKVANGRVLKAGGMSESAVLKWGLKRATDIERWDGRLHVVEAYPLFRGMKRGFSLKEKYALFLSDHLKVMSIVHLAMT
jgi:O-methyltransferase involved in polyketide biosynthesis